MIRVAAQKEPAVDQRERFLRLVAAIVESWVWIVLVPLTMTVATYAYLQSKSVYASETILRLSSEEVLILKSSRVFGAEVEKSIATGIVDYFVDYAESDTGTGEGRPVPCISIGQFPC